MRSLGRNLIAMLAVAAVLAGPSGQANAAFIITTNCPLEGSPGDTVTCELFIDSVPAGEQFVSIDFKAVYDEPPLKPVDVRPGALWPGSFLDWTEGGGTLDVGAFNLDPVTAPGEIFQVDFKIAPTAPLGSYYITFPEFTVDEVDVPAPSCRVDVIPEPSVLMALLGMGAVALGGYGWRRRKMKKNA